MEKLIELKGIELLYKINKLYYKWRLFSFYFLILLEKIMSHPKFLAFLKTSNSCIEVIIIILSAKSFETTEEANKTPQNSENEVDISNDFQEKLQTDETKNDIQEKEILLISLRLLSKIIEKNNLEYSHKQLQEKILTIKQNIKYDIYAEYLLAFFSHVCLVPELIGNLLLNKTPILIIELSQEILKKKDFLGKSSYFFFIINFFLNLHNNNLPNELQELYKSLELEKYLLNLIYEIIQKNEEPFQIFYAFEALCKILNRAISNQKIGDISIKIYFEDFSAREQQKFMDNVIDAVMNNMKKYPDNETLQIAGCYLIYLTDKFL